MRSPSFSPIAGPRLPFSDSHRKFCFRPAQTGQYGLQKVDIRSDAKGFAPPALLPLDRPHRPGTHMRRPTMYQEDRPRQSRRSNGFAAPAIAMPGHSTEGRA